MSEQNKKNKIDEIKNRLRKAPNGSGYYEDVSYLLQEIERKEKALQEIVNTEDLLTGGTAESMRNRAREAL